MKAITAKRPEAEKPLTRSETMARVRSRDTSPERAVRRILTDLGYRYRLHRADLPGTPDIAFIGRRKALFVHGCFWHGHNCARGSRAPKTNPEYWRTKIARNRARDLDVAAALDRLGWSAMTVWECELRDVAAVSMRLALWLR
ncbi:very short patch repair endonuclease [Sphingomonas sp. SUN019]|uniref:very short patch repair endonuclease n=1 Tax=Sphingomonas sp. SUN019 TaxID=2937788 RepID=UPI0021644244|nr:very short patch repair endonuclease [Sphingomonas sp. SUN019]UVO51553.1 very short patch repair endonuclease [Sphingomonas sp. SUN019]